ncbi:MAG: bifunctional riboflavin kinase/FAD synthetase [Dehalococcoidia bacterium]|nr:bifunctional riboflavin kinase/FAD synthetase [Dehalococcoidia bacterium]
MSTEQELAYYRPGGPTLLTVGVFDGVHRGHLSLIEHLTKSAQERGLLDGIVTFTPHPQAVLHPEQETLLLTSLDEKVVLLKEAGVHMVVPLTFTRDLSNLSPGQFITLLAQELKMEGLILGPDFSLGKDRAGTTRALEQLGSQMGFSVESVPPYMLEGRVVSSTVIRQAITIGDVETASRLLGRPFSMTGSIVSTSKRGTNLGFPTANLDVDQGRALPRNGVYATIAHVRGHHYPSVTNIGTRPTFGEAKHLVETHLLDFSDDIYGAALRVQFFARIRDEMPFETTGQLIAQIQKDVESARRILKAD